MRSMGSKASIFSNLEWKQKYLAYLHCDLPQYPGHTHEKRERIPQTEAILGMKECLPESKHGAVLS